MKKLYRETIPTLSDKVAVAFCLAAVAFLISGLLVHVTPVRMHVSPLELADPKEPSISGTGFASNAVYPTTQQPFLKGTLNFYGSWLRSNGATGTVHTAWYQAHSGACLFIAGYPNQPGNQISAQVQTAHSGVVLLPLIWRDEPEPREVWQMKQISFAGVHNPVRFRIVATDGSTSFWLAFSEPFLISGFDRLRLLEQLWLLVSGTAASLVFVLSPGLILRQKRMQSSGRRLAFVWIPVPGLLGLAVLGLAAWVGPASLTPQAISRVALSLLILFVTYRMLRMPLSTFTTALERRVLLVILVLVSIAVAKATYSVGPAGELYGGTISRSLEVGERSDSRIPFIITQLVAWRLSPYGEFSTMVHAPWNFSHRGPIAGLAAAAVVLISPVQVTKTFPDQPWTVFDGLGFSAYRIAMIVMAACSSLVAVFTLAELFLPAEWAFLAFLFAATAPFTLHEIYFTWPKLEAAYFFLLAGYLVFESRYLVAGLFLGLGYLCHPFVLAMLPCLLGFWVLVTPKTSGKAVPRSRRIYAWSVKLGSLLAGFSLWLILWRLVNGPNFSQESFLSFFAMAGGGPVTLKSWIQYRVTSLLNTLVPLNLFLFHQHESGLNSLWGPSPPVIPFFFQYWNTLPFGAGIVFFFCLVVVTYVAFRKERLWLLYVFVLPFLLFTFYMGWPSKGLLRDGLQIWFLGLMIFAAIIWRKHLSQSPVFWRFVQFALLFRGAETLAMLLLPSVWSQHISWQEEFAPTDVIALIVMISGTAWLTANAYDFTQKLKTARANVSQPRHSNVPLSSAARSRRKTRSTGSP